MFVFESPMNSDDDDGDDGNNNDDVEKKNDKNVGEIYLLPGASLC